jgi:beta-aspartyl-dipeptidase (metallo-type)
MHLSGGSGEGGFAMRTPEITLGEIVTGGTTTVVGCLGADTYTRNMPALLGHAKHLNEEGITAYIYSGGYPIPPTSFTGNIRTDMILIPEIIGAGEIAVSDPRGPQPTVHELVRLVADAHLGGLITKKCGVTHLHMGEGRQFLRQVREILDKHDVESCSIYPTHVGRNEELLKEAAELTARGVTVDLDVWDSDLVDQLQKFIKYGGRLDFVTISTDASCPSPLNLYLQMKAVMKELGWPLEKVLSLCTTNTVKVLKLHEKGRISEGMDADIVLMEKESLDITHVMARGKFFVKDKELIYEPSCMKKSNRKIEIYGKKAQR